MKLLITICARKGSKGLPSKNIRFLLGKPLIVYTIEQAKRWQPEGVTSKRIIVSTDGEEIADIARKAGAEVPFLRPAELATDTAGKLPVIQHALVECEKKFSEHYDCVVDLDPTAPMRGNPDLDLGLATFRKSGCELVFSVTEARKNPYFNIVERTPEGKVRLVKNLDAKVSSRQAAPKVWDMNASIYVYKPAFLKTAAKSIWDATTDCFEMPPEYAFDIDRELDFILVETLMKRYLD